MIDLYMLSMDLKNSQSDLRKQSAIIIRDIYRFVEKPTGKTQIAVEGWKKDFRYIYGDVEANLSSNNKLNITEMLERYRIVPQSGHEPGQAQMLFFSIQTYFSVLIKVMMNELLSEKADGVRDEGIILGEFARERGIANYCCRDWYAWPVYEMRNGFAEIMRRIREAAAGYRTEISAAEFAQNHNYDYIKQMYEAVIPRELRHALGEYYTPDWLAEETINTVLSFEGVDIGRRFIDPTCGSGTFVFKIIAAKRRAGASLEEILRSVAGMDINPLAVLTARTNYLLSIIDMLEKDKGIEIPVYNADIVKLQGTVEVGKADVIIGNPPWVNWEYMPEEYRKGSQHLWTDYSLFCAKGRDLSFSKEDISVLITYIVLDKLLREGGILAFVIRQGVFKSAQNGVGFRRFRLKDECGIKVLRVDDLSGIRAFDNAQNSTALVYMKKGADTIYPVPYVIWEKRRDVKRLSFNGYSDIQTVKGQMKLKLQSAVPAVEDDPSSIWLTADSSKLESMKKVLGKNTYKARTGVFTGGANAVYWLRINKKDGADIEVSNIVERARRKAENVTRVIEPTYVFPMLRGSNVKRWDVTYDTYLLCPHTAETKMWPVRQDAVSREAPKTYAYLSYFKDVLDGRKGFAGWEEEIRKQEFHAVLRVGAYTFSKYKVIWKFIASEFICAVIGSVIDPYLGEKLLIPNEKIMYVSTDNEEEAYYLCGVLSSAMVADCVRSYMNPTSISAHVLDKLCIPAFDAENDTHRKIASICKEGHKNHSFDSYAAALDRAVSELYR